MAGLILGIGLGIAALLTGQNFVFAQSYKCVWVPLPARSYGKDEIREIKLELIDPATIRVLDPNTQRSTVGYTPLIDPRSGRYLPEDDTAFTDRTLRYEDGSENDTRIHALEFDKASQELVITYCFWDETTFVWRVYRCES